MNAFFVSSVAALVAASAASAGFTGFTAARTVLSNGNIQYKVFANFDAVGLPAGQSWVFLNAYSHSTVSGTMGAVHQDFFTADGEVGTWQAGSSVSAADRDFDSWVTSSGLATSSGWGTALDPGFTNGGTVGDVNNGAGWYDATPAGPSNPDAANTVTGGRMLLIQIVRAQADDFPYTAKLSITYKVSGSTPPIQPGPFQYSIGGDPCSGGPDCNNNGCNDAHDITSGSSADINSNGIPDECEPDCNDNDRPDAYDISTGSSADINTNGVPDECEADCNNNDYPDLSEIAQGLISDCNADQIPDDCQGAARVALMSADLGSPSGADARVAIFSNLIPAESPVKIVVRAIGDLSSTSEFIEPTLNGVPAQRLFETGANDCPAQPDVGILSIQPGTFNELISDSGTLAIRLACPITVDGTECKGAGSLTVEVLYTGITDTGDCNGNERLDICEIADSTSPDCNANLKPDSCDIASGFSADCNTNGIPDSCDIASGAADCNTNGVPDSCDVAAGTSPDIDANNKPDECQTVAVNAGGSIQAVINAAPANEMRIINVAPGTYAGPINLLGKPIRLVGTAGPALTTISGTGGQNLSVVRAISGEPSISLVKGFTIQGGTIGGPLPGSPGVLAGGGVLFAFSSTSMADCVLQNNGSAFGAGAYLRTHDGSVTGCTFRNNTSQAYAGGLQLFDCTTTVSGCTFSGNLAVTAGGAMHMVNGQPKLVNCSFGANICNEQGGAMSWDPVSNGSLLSLIDCTISGNTASTIGGGIFIYPTGVASET
ncbi:MAG: hypothetical protein RL527_1395, partial [Planctomycetota bacterium]